MRKESLRAVPNFILTMRLARIFQVGKGCQTKFVHMAIGMAFDSRAWFTCGGITECIESAMPVCQAIDLLLVEVRSLLGFRQPIAQSRWTEIFLQSRQDV